MISSINVHLETFNANSFMALPHPSPFPYNGGGKFTSLWIKLLYCRSLIKLCLIYIGKKFSGDIHLSSQAFNVINNNKRSRTNTLPQKKMSLGVSLQINVFVIAKFVL